MGNFNFRFSTQSTANGLQQEVLNILLANGMQEGSDFDLKWTLGGEPFLTTPGTLVDAVVKSIAQETGLSTELSTTGGTSDGRFIAKICPQIIEFGPPNGSIHKINEHIALSDIEPLKNIYKRVLIELNQQVVL